MMTFLAFHGDPTLRAVVLDRLALAGEGSVLEQLAGPGADMAAAHRATGFPRTLLLLVEAIHTGLPASERQAFLVQLVDAATPSTDLADVPDLLFERLFALTLARQGVRRLRPGTAGVRPLAGLAVDDAWPARAAMAVVDRAGEGVPEAVSWLAALADDPVVELQHIAGELLTIVRAV